MRFTTKVFLTHALSDMRTILFFVVAASVLSSVIAYGFGYLDGQADTRDYFMALLGQ